ncbi:MULTISPECIES: peptidylprolyl isomerase [Shewanella]|uniref:Peptidyl-prolyl cis-trans isomerase n=2 Tax=Shewanella TaxID=22 RepID=A0AAJ1BF57_9GAMM|nr:MULTISPECIES: peptidylprolyl isomerase [Shewanella]AZQ09923.1 Peptidyl-prolyl cis-trans isomerase B [Shewanella khirikhana]MCH4293636.1 peptidylprolyl isomerase [Shewanella zhuhaiensis]
MITLHTNFGDIKIALNHEQAPVTAENFQRYASEGFFDGTIFHRVIDGFMIQGGGFTEDMVQKRTHDPIKNEANNGLSNKVGTLAMARTSDPHSATAQFFINVNDNTFLDFKSESMQGWGYCVFGEVVEGLDVVNAIKGVNTGNRGMHQDVPLEAVVIEKVSIEG